MMRCLLALALACVLRPTLAELERTFRVPESAAPGHIVGHLQNSPSAADKVNFYVVFPPESGVEDVLAVSDTTGEIRTRSALDFETKSSYVFLAIPTDGSAGIRVTVSVIDENDNAPIFPVPSIDVQLSEYARVNAEMPLPSATDADFDNFGVQEYRIASGNVNNAFRLATRKLNGILYVDLIVNAELDREYRDRYQLTVEAVDGGNPPKVGQLLVNVSIIDANDNPPQFSQPRYLAQIERNTTVGSAVIAVSATDADIGPNGQVEYRLLPNPGDSHKKFSIDPKSGIISLAEPLADQPAVKNYELLVVARDFGQPLPLESTAFVTVTIMNNKDSAAKIRTIFLSQDGTPTVSESAQIGDMVARFSVDWDGREHERAARSTVNMTLSGGGSFFTLQAADAAVFVLIVAKPLDRETFAAFDLMVIATDSNGRLAHQNVTLLVTDVNDNVPRFTESEYEAEVREKSPKGSSVLRVTATDSDAGDNARISYSLSASPPFDQWFQIDADTGLITSLHAVDCEISAKPELVVVANDHGQPPLSAKAKIVVSVLDVNDNSPLFEKSVYNASLAEDTEVGTCFLKVKASDPDCGVNANVRYALADHPSTKRVFSIDDATGTICLDAPLDYEQRRRYQLTVIAQDGGGLSSTALVDVHVEDRDDNAPIFYPSVYNISVRESVPTGSPLLIVSATDNDEGLFGQITYRLSSPSPLFRIDTRTGELYVHGQLFPDVYRLGVIATDGGGLSSVEPAAVNVAVLREGFISPKFESKIYRFTASEDTMPGISIGRVKATGPEPIVYDIYSGDPNGEFKVDRTTGELLIVKYVDADERESVLLNVQAAMGNPPSYNHTQVIIAIEDVNDNNPEFEMPVVKTTVREDQQLHEPFFSVQATDKDRQKNGELTYRLLSSDPAGPFMVRPLSGQISLTKKIDYETVNLYRLVIGATDGGIPPRSANVTVELSVLDENDHPPKFSSNAYEVEIAENVRTMTNLVQVNASDEDATGNGELSYGLKDNVDGLFGMMADSGWVYVRKPLDRETKAEYKLIATATDHGRPPKTSEVSVTIILKDVNDRAPNCTAVGPFAVLENAPANTLIGVIHATDPDLGENGTVFYRLDRSFGDLFRIESSGEIYTKKPLDAETQNEFQIDVIAQDNGSPPLSTTCQIVVQVLDVNDNAPYFILPHQNKVSIREEQPIGTEVVQVRASDPDQGANGTIIYSLVDNSVGSRVFRIDRKTGVITTAAVLDFESLALDPTGSLELTVKATDGGGLEATKTLVIEIVDVADKGESGAVSLITGSEGSNATVAFEVSESVPVGTKLGPLDRLRAEQFAKIDADHIEGQLLDVTFDIVSGNSQGLFEIDRLSSVLYVVARLDYETSPSHTLRIARTDLSRPKLPVVSYLTVTVGVLEENDNTPEFLEDPVIFSVSEDAKEGLVVWRFNATDRDVGANGRLLYRIVEQTPEKSFEIEPVTGELWLSRRLDRETVSDYLVIVEASDQSIDTAKRRSSKATARVYVTDVNDNVARFTSHTSAVVYEDEIVGHPFFYVVAKDDDWLDNGLVGYKLTSGNDAGYFAINQSSGAVSLTKRLNRDSERSYRLGVEAYDHGHEPRSNRQILTVNVESMNEDAPRFHQSVYHANVSENAPVGTFVTRLTATDARGATLIFVLPTQGPFALDATTGDLVTAVPLDREEQHHYSFTVFVRDIKEEHRYDSASVIVQVDDLNDNEPVLAKASCQSVSVSENARFDALHRFIAFDNDTDVNGLVTFSIEGGNEDNKFHINASTGVLSCEPLDREVKAAYNLTIVARDNGKPSLHDSCLFQVSVIDQNDVHPEFEKNSYEAQVAENTAASGAILRLKAIDKDEGRNGQVLYGLVGKSNGYFEIDSLTGDLSVVGQLDYERRNVYVLTVRATDQGVTEAKYSDVNVTISVIDMNDNAPQFASIPIRVNLPTQVPSGQPIAQASAFDKDGPGPNSAISYGLTAPSTDFVIDPVAGTINARQSISMVEGANRYLLVTATDNGDPKQSSTGVVEITFGSGAKHPQSIEFNHQTYKVDLPESALGGQLVVVCVARRYSNGESDGITYNIVAGNELQAFGVENWSGKVFVADVDKMRSERSRRFNLLVEASASIVNEDSTDAQRLAYAAVEIEVVDDREMEPQFLQQRYSTSVSEAKNRGEFVIQVAASHRSAPEDARLTYSIVRGNLDSAFTIDESGTVKTNVELDREIQDSYNLTVTATDSQQPPRSATTLVEVKVQDVNDNRPSFPPVRIVRVSEYTPVGTLLATVTANDVDADSTLLYSFVPGAGDGAGMFEIDRLTGRILLAEAFDYERMDGYTLEIEVSDGVNTARTGLKVLVIDENDNAPEFDQPFYQVSLPEDTPADSSIIQVHATDLDSAENGQITYQLVDNNSGGSFRINETSGAIYLERPLAGASVRRLLTLLVSATDGGAPQRSTVSVVQVRIVSRSDKRQPKFEKDFYSFTINENAALHDTVGQLALAKGHDFNGLLYGVKSGDPDRMFRISSDGWISLARTVDREQRDEYRLEISVHTKSNSVANSTATVLIRIEDANDNIPSFSDPKMTVWLNESVTVGQTVLRLSATDRDAGDNGRVVYEMTSGNELGLLALDRASGTLTLARPIKDTDPLFSRIVVRASDQGSPPKSTIASILVNIKFDLKSGPFFPVPLYLGRIPESAPIGTLVFTAKATDRQGKHLTKLFYSFDQLDGADMMPDGNKSRLFAINEQSGELRTNAIFDYEQKSSYRLSVTVKDGAGRSAVVPGQVLIKGVDEYAPEFAQKSYAFKVSFDIRPGSIIGSIVASDKDAGADGQVTYSLKEPTAYFAINPATGVLTVEKSLKELSTKVSFAQTSRSIRSTTSQETSVQKEQGTAPMVSVIYLTVIASSGTGPADGMRSEVSVVLNLGFFSIESAENAAALDPSIITVVSIILILLLVLVLLFLVFKLRRRKDKNLGRKPAPITKSAPLPRKQTVQQGTMYTPTTAQSVVTLASAERDRDRLEPTFHCHPSPVKAGGKPRQALPAPPLPPVGTTVSNGRRQLNSTSAYSNKSSGDDEDDELRRLTSRSTDRSAREVHTRSMPDSGIDVYPDEDNNSMTSSDVPSAREYLTSLGVTEPSVHQRHNINQVVAGGRVEALEMNRAAAARLADDDEADLNELIYSKVNQVLAEDGNLSGLNRPLPDASRLTLSTPPDPVFTSGGTLGRRLKAQQTQPSYQPLTQVFSEISRLRNGSDRRPPMHYHSTPVHNSMERQSPWTPNYASSTNPADGGRFVVTPDLRGEQNEVEIKI